MLAIWVGCERFNKRSQPIGHLSQATNVHRQGAHPLTPFITSERNDFFMVAKCSLCISKKASFKHNERTYDPDKMNRDGHIDRDRISKNVVLVKADLEKFYEENFKEVIEKFNENNLKSRHCERNTSVEAYRKKTQREMREAIIQLGDHDTYTHLVETHGQDKADVVYVKYLKSAFEKWKERYPNFKVVGATIHMDETKNGTPHLHLDFIPVAHYKRGQKVKVSLDGALKEMGYPKSETGKYSDTPYRRWLPKCRTDYEALAQEFCRKEKLDIQILPSEKTKSEHEDIQTYRVREEARKKILPVIKEYLIDGKKSKDLADEIIKNSQAVQDVFSENNKTIEKQLKQKEFELSELQKALNEQSQKVKQDKAEISKIKQELEEKQKELQLKTIDLLREKKKFELANSELEHRTLCTARLMANEIMRAVGYDPNSNAIETIQLDNKGYVKEGGVSYVHD